MSQLSLLELAEEPLVIPGNLLDLAEPSETTATMAVMVTLSQARPIVPNERYDEPITRAVLLLNNRERASEPESEGYRLLVHAQDWLCLELPEWSHWVLREL